MTDQCEAQGEAPGGDLAEDVAPRDSFMAALALSGAADGDHRRLLESLSEHFHWRESASETKPAATDGVDPRTRYSSDGILEIIAGWQRQIASAHAEMLQWVSALNDHPDMSAWVPRSFAADSTAAELQMRLGITRRSAQGLVSEAHALTGALWPVLETLRAGEIDHGKAAVFVEVLGEQSLEACIAVTEQVLPDAPETSHSQLRRKLNRVLVQIDPDGVAARSRSAFERRRVNAVQPRGDGMATFSAYLPAASATALDRVCEAAARAARTDGDPRTLDQLRADVLHAMAESALLTGVVGIEGETADVFRFDPAHAAVQVIATPQAQRAEREAAWADIIHWELHSDHASDTDPSSDTDPGSSDGGSEPPAGGQNADFRSAQAPGEAHQMPSGSFAAPPRPGIDAPELEGYGAIPPALVPDLINNRWVRVTEPVAVDSAGLDHRSVPPDAPGYRPTAALDRYVRTRDGTCQAPGCSVAARLCDLDHLIPYPEGPTSAENLRALCRHHHRLKTLGGHTYDIDDDGALTWRTPAGQVLRRFPTGRVRAVDWLERAFGVRPSDLEIPDLPWQPEWDDEDPA